MFMDAGNFRLNPCKLGVSSREPTSATATEHWLNNVLFDVFYKVFPSYTSIIWCFSGMAGGYFHGMEW